MAEQNGNRKANGQFKPGYTPSTAWIKGQSGNPNGRRGSLKDIIDEIGDEVDDKGISNREQIMRKVMMMARRGDMKAVTFLADRTEGKAKEFRETTVKTEPIKVFDFED